MTSEQFDCVNCCIIIEIYSRLLSCGSFCAQIFTLGLLHIHIAFVASKAVVDQQADESQVSSSQIAQQRFGYDYSASLEHDHLHEHHDHHEHHDPGFWKKKVTWKEGWKKYWKEGKKQIWKTSFKKIWKPVWVPIQVPVWKDIQVRVD